MSEPVSTTRGSLKIFRFTFPRVSDGMREFTIASFDVTAATEADAKKDAATHLVACMGAVGNVVTPEQAVAVATIKVVAENVIIIEVK